MKNQKTYGDLIYYPDPERDHRYFYYAKSPMPKADPNGNPMISLIGGGSNWFLQVSAEWGAKTGESEKLVKYLLKEELIKSSTDLKPAPLTIKQAALFLYEKKTEVVLATSDTSKHYPYSAAFNTMISEDRQKLVVSAFHGGKNILLVTYEATLEVHWPVEMEILGPIHQARLDLNSNSSAQEIKNWLETQITNGVIELRTKKEMNMSKSFLDKVREKLFKEAIAAIQQFLLSPEMAQHSTSLKIKINESLIEPLDIKASTDISTWFTNDPNDHIKIIA